MAGWRHGYIACSVQAQIGQIQWESGMLQIQCLCFLLIEPMSPLVKHRPLACNTSVLQDPDKVKGLLGYKRGGDYTGGKGGRAEKNRS